MRKSASIENFYNTEVKEKGFPEWGDLPLERKIWLSKTYWFLGWEMRTHWNNLIHIVRNLSN